MKTPVIDLLALPCAGASATMYLRWRRQLPAWIRLVPVELPGRGARLSEPCIEGFESQVDLICREHAASLSGRYALFGHSMGALLAYGVARRQLALGQCLPQALFASASPAPSRRHPDHFPSKGDDAALIAHLRKQGGTPEEVFENRELLRLTLDTLGADYRVCESFAHGAGARLPSPLHVFAGRQDDIALDRIEAWRHEAAGDFSLDWFEGGHFYIRQHEPAVLSALERTLAQAVSEPQHAARAVA